MQTIHITPRTSREIVNQDKSRAYARRVAHTHDGRRESQAQRRYIRSLRGLGV